MKSPNILFLATQYDWMEPYTQSAVKNLWHSGCHLIYAAETPAQVGAFDWLPQGQVTEIKAFELPGWEHKLFQLHPCRLIALINRKIKELNPDVVMALTIDTGLSFFLPKLQNRIPTIYVVHNVHPHAKLLHSRWARLKRKITIEDTQIRLNAKMRNQVVLSRWSADRLLEQFPTHRVCHLTFPTLVTDAIAHGTDIAPELVGEKGYILFFGRVEKYKGVERLLTLIQNAPLLASRKLVIAGRGELTQPIPPEIADRVIWLNRYVADSEVASLFRNAAVAVYPYNAATQTGVISIAAYFGTPIVASPQKYFMEIREGDPAMQLVDCDDIPAFERAVYDCCVNPMDSTSIYERIYVGQNWSRPFELYIKEVLDAEKVK